MPTNIYSNQPIVCIYKSQWDITKKFITKFGPLSGGAYIAIFTISASYELGELLWNLSSISGIFYQEMA
jgi:hypothetical protein